jgi:hypothetical protein
VKRTFRILRVATTLISLLLALVSIIFWIRSRRTTDVLTLNPFPNKLSLVTQSGTLYLDRDRPWLEPAELRRGNKTPVYEHSFLGFGIREKDEDRTWQAKSSRIIPYRTHIKSIFLPLWSLCALFSIVPLLDFARIAKTYRRRQLGLCRHCGYDLRGSPSQCPECGALIKPNQKVKTLLPIPP